LIESTWGAAGKTGMVRVFTAIRSTKEEPASVLRHHHGYLPIEQDAANLFFQLGADGAHHPPVGPLEPNSPIVECSLSSASLLSSFERRRLAGGVC
jgi:hypothetical protein